MSAYPKIGIVILHYRDLEATIIALNSLRQAIRVSNVEAQIVIVDNDGMACKKQEFDDSVHYIHARENIGFGQGMNLGASWLTSNHECNYFWFLNNDICVNANAIVEFSAYLVKHPEKKIIGPTIIDAQSKKIQCAGGCKYNSWLGMDKAVAAITANQNASNITFDYIYGAAMMVKSDFFNAIDGFCKDYFLYFEELELAAHCEPKELGWCSNVEVRHQGQHCLKTDRTIRTFCSYHAALSCFHFTFKHYRHKLPSVILCRLLGKLIHAITLKDFSVFFSVLKAKRDFKIIRYSDNDSR